MLLKKQNKKSENNYVEVYSLGNIYYLLYNLLFCGLKYFYIDTLCHFVPRKKTKL